MIQTCYTPLKNLLLLRHAGEERGAGTDADVLVEISGEKGEYGPHQLNAQPVGGGGGGGATYALCASAVPPQVPGWARAHTACTHSVHCSAWAACHTQRAVDV